MRIVLGYRTFANFAGSETYLLTVAEQLQLLGHDVLVYTYERGPMSEMAEERGIRVVDSSDDLPEAVEAVLAQDGATAYDLAGRYPDIARVYVVHSTEFVNQNPPQLPDVAAAVVVMNERVGNFVRAMASRPELVRLRQPIDMVRFGRIGLARAEARKVLVLGHDHGGLRFKEIERVCAAAGLEVDLVGRRGRVSATPEQEIAEADIVIGIGRCVIEAMTARKAAYVSGVVGADGWVTPESYPAIEADGFSGRAFDTLIDEQRLLADLRAWTPDMGLRNKELALLNHDAGRHAAELVALWERLGAEVRPPAGPTEELARLVRLQAQTENRAILHATQSAHQRKQAELAEARLAAVQTSLRYRLAQALAVPFEKLRLLAARLRSGGRRLHD